MGSTRHTGGLAHAGKWTGGGGGKEPTSDEALITPVAPRPPGVVASNCPKPGSRSSARFGDRLSTEYESSRVLAMDFLAPLNRLTGMGHTADKQRTLIK
mgnify:FL=1